MNITTSQEFWAEMVIPDCEDYRKNVASLRHAFHSAISLFHLHDWIFTSHRNTVSTFQYSDKSSAKKRVKTASDFANYLERSNTNFGLIRGVANSAKHLVLAYPSPIQNSPSNAANTQVQSTGFGVGLYGAEPFGGTPRVIIEGEPDNIEYLDVMNAVFKMWETLKKQHGW
jgi:hypothetical protein